MNRVMLFSVVAMLLQACSKAPEAPAAPVVPVAAVAKVINWVRPDGANIEAVFAQAVTANKPVFLYWGAVWCPPCNQLKATVFNRQDFIELSTQFIPVYLDGDTPGAQKLGARFKVRGYPTMILFKPDGTELTRLPGEVESGKYLEILNLGLSASSSVKESLAAALGGNSAALTPQAWRQLAYYSWDQDEAQLVPQNSRTATLHKLAGICPPTLADAATRLDLKAMVASALDSTPLPNPAAALARTQQLVTNTTAARESFDMLVNYSKPLVQLLTRPGTDERTRLLAAWNVALDRFYADASLSRADRLSAVASKVDLAGVDLPQGAKPTLQAALMAQVSEAAATADKTTTNTYERQAVIPSVAQLLSEAGLLDASDAVLKSELPNAVSPYYHMLVLASNAKARGDKPAALDWSERAWNESKGPATRLQWGSSYVNRLIELSPQDTARIQKAATGVLSDLEAVPETFYERNRRGLDRMGGKLLAWSKQEKHAEVIKKLDSQLQKVCAKLPAQDEAHAACKGILKTRPPVKKA